MKNFFFTLLVVTLMVACSPKDDQDPIVEVVPSSPSSLTVTQVDGSKATLSWKDNSDNETGFYIERKLGSNAFVRIGTTAGNAVQFTDAGLKADSVYTYRVTAYNATGASATYSNEKSVRMYVYVQIGNTLWMQKNLDVERYRNGDVIPQVTNATEWANLTTGAWCYYANNTSNGIVYGKLYNWYAVNDPRGLAPQGWHVATNAEWSALTTELGGVSLAGGPMKSLEHWTSPNTGATNSSGFSALGGGARVVQDVGGVYKGIYTNMSVWGAWWTATEDYEGVSFYRILYNDNTKSEGYHNLNVFGMSVRCVKD